MLRSQASGESPADQSIATIGISQLNVAPNKRRIERFRPIRQSWARFCTVLFDDDPRDFVQRIALVILIYVVAVVGREALHTMMPGSVRYLTFFPALLAAGLLCRLFPTLALLVAFSITGFFWIEPDVSVAPLYIHVALPLAFFLAGAAVVIPTVYSVNAHRRLIRQDEQLGVINDELRHRLKNLFAVISSICIQSFKKKGSLEEMSRNMIGRIQAIASAQDFLSITSTEGSNFGDLVHAIVDPICPDQARVAMSGEPAVLPSDVTSSFAFDSARTLDQRNKARSVEIG